MKILYFGSLCDEEWFNETVNKSEMAFSVAQYSFEKSLIEGLSKDPTHEMKIYNLHQEVYYPKGHHLFFRKEKNKLNERYMVHYLFTINLPVLKESILFIQGVLLTFLWIVTNFSAKDKVILTPFNYTPLSLGIYFSSWIFKVKRVNIFTDLSSDILKSTKRQNMSWVKRKILPLYMKVMNFVEYNYDGYILFTLPMKDKVNPSNKPYLVMEGIFEGDLDLSEVPKSKAIMHAGTLAFEYGVKNILDAFEQIEDEELELWLFGDGDMRDYIKELASRDKRVTYFGFMPRKQVFEYEKKATLLVNARDSKDVYTMYSFPSKTFEYMASGTPFLTTNIKCIPEEYKDYLYILPEEDSLEKKIKQLLAKQEDELRSFGKKARNFILENKNSNTQSKKVSVFLTNLLSAE